MIFSIGTTLISLYFKAISGVKNAFMVAAKAQKPGCSFQIFQEGHNNSDP
jgi:hypothetical protein